MNNVYSRKQNPPGNRTIKRLQTILFFFCSFCIAQAQSKITGIVKDTNGEPVVGVSVLEKGTTNGATTNVQGEYKITVTNDFSTLIYSFIGYTTEEIVIGKRTQIDITLLPDITALSEIVVIGYGTQKRENITSAIASVKAENFIVGPRRDASDLIKGKVAGLSISNGTGNPSQGPSISLRGISSLQGGTTPLILINGIPGDFNAVAPEDIISIDVLKDASAAAIYGTRGANGVIIITTRNANKDQAPSISYHHYTAVSTLGKKADFLDASRMRELLAAGQKLPFADEGYTTDWVGEITRAALSNNDDVSISGGNGRSSYVGNISYINQQGTLKGSATDKFRVSLDVNHKMFNDKLSLNLNVLNGIQNNDLAGGDYVYRQATIRNPTDRPKNDNGTWIETSRFQYSNPLALIHETTNKYQNKWLRLVGSANLDITKDLSVNLMLGQTSNNEFTGYSESKKHYSNVINGRNGVASKSTGGNKRNNMEITSKYMKTLGLHNFTLLGGYSYQYSVNEGFSASNYDFPTDNYSYNNLGAGNALSDGKAGMSSFKNDDKLIGFFGRVSYGFDNKYNVLASVRREGSSKFGNNNKWGTFMAVSAGWTISNENFLKEVNQINNLKLRAGFGQTGIIPRYSYLSKTLYSYEGNFYTDGKWVKGLVPTSNPNPDLRWEKTAEVNIGLDFALFNNRISGSVDVYNKKTKDMLWDYNVPTPPYLYSSITANVGKMQNKGFEVLLNLVPVKKNNFVWNSSITFSHNKNRLLSLSNDLYTIDGNFINTGNTGDPISFTTHRLEVGQSIGNFWGLKSVDITDNGKWIIETKTGERKTLTTDLYNDENKQYLGNGIPKYLIGLSNNFSYKRITVSTMFTGALGFQILNTQRMFYENPTINYNMLASAFDKVYGKTQLNYNQTYVSYYLEDGDYLKLDNITLSYALPLLNVKFIKVASIYISGTNLLTFTKYKGLDPEIKRDDILSAGVDFRDKYPTNRTYTMGVNITF